MKSLLALLLLPGTVLAADPLPSWNDGGAKKAMVAQALDEARARGWTVVSVKDDWKHVFPR